MLTLQRFTNMFELQNELNRHVDPRWEEAGYDWRLAIMAECVELADQVGWKWWKHQPQAPLAQIHLELVDIWHFILSMALERHREVDLIQLAKGYQRPPNSPLVGADVLNAAKVLSQVAADPARSLADIVGRFMVLMYRVRLSFDDMYELYMAKAMLNLFRWDNGYKEGTYQKHWRGVEDNVYLESIIHSFPDLPHTQITALLQQRYREVTA